MSTIPHISVLLPVYNERTTILANLPSIDRAIERLIGMRGFEILVLNNGSTDGTETLAAQLESQVPRARLINIVGKGRGLALNAGYRIARGEIVCVLGIDRAWEETFLADSLQKLDEGYDVVFGQKTHPDSIVERSVGRNLASMVIRWGIAALFSIRPQDTQCVKTFRKSTVPFLHRLHNYNYFSECEFFLRAHQAKLGCARIGICVEDRRPDSKVKLTSIVEFFREALQFRQLWERA